MSAEAAESLFSILRVGATVTGLAGPTLVKVLSVDRLTDDSASVAYRSEDGALAEKIIFSDAIRHIKPVKVGAAFSLMRHPKRSSSRQKRDE